MRRAPGPAPGPRRVAAIIPLVMVVVAGVQAWRVVAFDQSSWQGAGFGMFATYDFDSTRTVVVVDEGADVEEPLDLSRVPNDLLVRARVAPTDDALRAVGGAVAGGSDVHGPLRVEVRGPDLDGATVSFDVLRVVRVDP